MDGENILRLAVFILTAVLMAALEIARPRRRPDPDRKSRWVGNLGVVAVSTVLARLVFPIVPMALAATLRGQGLGIFPALGLPLAVEIFLGILILDLAMFGQHRLFHAWRPLWRVHRMHHADTFFDFSTGVRFHPVEILISMAFKLAMNCNFGFNFPWRDRLFSNYQIQPASGHENMPLGLKIFRNAR
jgi:sterol desaturase/sphingolipid hydroxylase (fatty acid hydroxylase superfamily)